MSEIRFGVGGGAASAPCLLGRGEGAGAPPPACPENGANMTAILTWIGIVAAAFGPDQGTAWWDAQVEASLDRAPSRKAAWVKQLEACPAAQRAGLGYLVKY